MLESMEKIFDHMPELMLKLKKKRYEANMKDFREANDHFFLEMTSYAEQASDHETAVKEIAERFVSGVTEAFSVKGRIKPRIQADLNLFMIYYVFPALLLTQSEYDDAIAKGICSLWGTTFKDSKIGYTNYEEIYAGFREKILGIF